MRRLVLIAGLGLLGLAFAVQPAAAQGWGTVKGKVVFGGDKVPERKELNVTKDQEHCLMNGKLLDEEWTVNPKNKGVRYAFVWLAPAPGGKMAVHPDLKEPKDKTVTMDQPCCQFVPHALAMREGQVLIAKNSAPIAHNFKYGGTPTINPGGNPQIPPKEEYQIKNLKADRLPITVECTQHPWMRARVRVFDHPYFAVTDADGGFEIKNAPAGEYYLIVWHEGVGYQKVEEKDVDGKKVRVPGQKITIKADGTVEETIPIKPS